MTILFGVRSPLVVDLEESLFRAGRPLSSAVSVGGTPRLLDLRRVVTVEELADLNPAAGFLSCAFSPLRRRELVGMALELGLSADEALIDPTATLARSVRVGAGSFINAGVVIGAVSLIGEHVLINRSASIGHHSVLENYVSIGPGATLAGNVHVGEGAIIGVGAVILPDIRIGAGAIVAGGSLVRRNVPEGVLVAGNPAVQKPFDIKRSSLNVEDGE